MDNTFWTSKVGGPVEYDIVTLSNVIDNVAHPSDTLQSVKAYAYFNTADDAAAFVALFPKSTRVKPSTLCGSDLYMYTAIFQADFLADDINKGKNETGAKRVKKFFAVCKQNGIAVKRTATFANSATGDLTDFNLT